METETLQVARFFKNPEWTSHYQIFQEDIRKGFTSLENGLLFALCTNLHTERGRATDEEFLDHCLERSFTWSFPDGENTHRPSQSKVLQKSNGIREGILREEDPVRAEENFRSWLQRTITCNATVEEPTMAQGKLKDPFFDASEKLTQLGLLPVLAKKEEKGIFFPLSSTEMEFRPRIPIGFDVFEDYEFQGGPEFDGVLVLAGETNVGKTHLGLFAMSNLALQRKNVLVVSGEDSPQENKKRLLCHFLRHSEDQVLRMNPLERTEHMRKLYGHEEDLQSLHNHIRTRFGSVCPEEGTLTPRYIDDQVKRLEDSIQDQVHAVMVDYLQKGRPDEKNNRMQRDEELELFVNKLKEDGENKRLSLLISQIPSHAAGGKTEFLGLKQATARSYAATWGAHYIITMNRPEEEMNRLGSSRDKRPRLNFFLCKNKNGPIGTCYALGFPNEARWRFFRTKSELLRCAEQANTDTP